MVDHRSVCKFSKKGKRGPSKRLNDIWDLTSKKAVHSRLQRAGLKDLIKKIESLGQEDVPQLMLMVAHLQFREKLKKKEAAMVKSLSNKLKGGKSVCMNGPQQAYLRSVLGLSVQKINGLRDLLDNLGFHDTNPFTSYQNMHKAEVDSLPTHVAYYIKNKNGTCIFQQDERDSNLPNDILEDYKEFDQRPKPNMCGSYWLLSDVIAKQLQGLEGVILQRQAELVKLGSYPLPESNRQFHVCLKVGEDGMGDTPEKTYRSEMTLPNKIVRCAVGTLQGEYLFVNKRLSIHSNTISRIKDVAQIHLKFQLFVVIFSLLFQFMHWTKSTKKSTFFGKNGSQTVSLLMQQF
jgi:hypothetical protein